MKSRIVEKIFEINRIEKFVGAEHKINEKFLLKFLNEKLLQFVKLTNVEEEEENNP